MTAQSVARARMSSLGWTPRRWAFTGLSAGLSFLLGNKTERTMKAIITPYTKRPDLYPAVELEILSVK